MTIHIIIRQESETCPASKQEMKYNNRNERDSWLGWLGHI